MFEHTRFKKVAMYPVGLDPVEFEIPGLVAEFKLDRCIIDYATGEEMDAVLPVTDVKTYEKFGFIEYARANQPRYTDNGLLIEGEVYNICPDADLTTLPYAAGAIVTLMPDEVAPDGTTGKVYRVQFPASSGAYVEIVPMLGVIFTITASAYIRANGADNKFGFADSIGWGLREYNATDEWVRYKASIATELGINICSDGYATDILVCFPQGELGDNLTSYIPSSGMVAVRPTEAGAADNGISYDLTNNPELAAIIAAGGSGTFYLKYKANQDLIETAVRNLVTFNEGSTFLRERPQEGINKINVYDGTNTIEAVLDWTVDSINEIYVDWGDGEMTVTTYRDGVLITSDTDTFAGSWPNDGKMFLKWGNETSHEFMRIIVSSVKGWRLQYA
jgi:hypothetical protein